MGFCRLNTLNLSTFVAARSKRKKGFRFAVVSKRGRGSRVVEEMLTLEGNTIGRSSAKDGFAPPLKLGKKQKMSF